MPQDATQTGSATRPARPGRSWRGASSAEPVRYRWQLGRDLRTAGVGGGRFRRLRIGIFTTLAALLLVLLLWYLLYAPVQTPVLAVAATRYQWPLRPNAWATENLEGLTQLHGKTLKIADMSDDWRSLDRGLGRLDEELKKARQRSGRAHVIVLYLSVHGGLDGAGKPCLIPPGAPPHDSQTWLPLSTLFEHVRAAKLPDRVHKLVVLDSSREVENWSLGQVTGGFAEALPQAVVDAKIPNLAILVSPTLPGSAGDSATLRATVFGHYLRLGLAGAADRQASGNADGRVSIQELRGYVAQQINHWMGHYRGATGAAGGPQLVPPEANFDVAWSLRSAELEDMLDRAERARNDRAAPTVSLEKIGQLWTQLDRLRPLVPWRYDPLAWRGLEHRLLWLEELAVAGKAYEEQAHSLLGDVSSELNAAQQRRAAAQAGVSLPAHVAIVSHTAGLPSIAPHNLPLAALWGSADSAKLSALQTQFDQCQRDPSIRNLDLALKAFDDASLPAATEEANLLALWQRQFVLPSWPDGGPLGRVLQAHVLAQRCAIPQGPGGMPGDERAHAWIRPQLAALDPVRRELEDAALVGEQRGANRLSAADSLVERLSALDTDQRTTKVLALRDELWSRLPYYAAWLCRPQHDSKAQESADGIIAQTLLPLLADARALEKALERSEPKTGEEPLVWKADAPADAAQKKLAALESYLQAAVDRVSKAEVGAAAIDEIDAILATPLVSADGRTRLVQKRLELELKLAGSFESDESDSDTGGAPSAATSAPHLTRCVRWRPHPLTALLDLDESATAEGAANVTAASSPAECLLHLASLGEKVRQRLAALSKGPLVAPPRFANTANAPPAVGMAALCQAESSIRRAAALWFNPPAIDPVAELRRADLQQLLLWSAGRALDDFYGPARAGEEPFFATAAADYLAAARAIGPLSQEASAYAHSLDGLLARRRIAAREALAITASDLLLVEQAPAVDAALEVKARTPEAEADLPVGTATVFLADSAGRLGPAGWPLMLPKPRPQVDEVLLTEKEALETARLKGRGPFVQAIVSLRGNDFVAPVLLRAPGGAQVGLRAVPYGPPQVTVLGYEQKRASVVFILDCSHSMSEPVRVEAPAAAGRAESTRMEIAKGALRALLADLAERGNMRVGVRLLGHRVGWSTTETDKLLRQTNYAEEIPAELRPYADVEQVLPLGRFDSLAAGKVFDKLQTVQAWGESPIYLALQQSIADFGPDDASGRSIVVITDGQNYQFNAPREFAPALSDVISAAERAKIAVQIVGYDIPAAEATAARRDFEQIASRTGGSFVAATNATTLLETLQRLLRPGEFRVLNADGIAIAQQELGHPAVLYDHRGRQPYAVAYESLREPIELVGGEAAELAIERGAQRLAVVPYLKGNPRFQAMVNGADASPSPFQAGMHRPLQTREGLQFPVSIQRADGHFVPRPMEMWIEVSPVGLPPETETGPYIFYDTPLAAGTGAPLANLLTRNWPASAAKAEVRVWMKSAPSPIVAELPLADIADRLPEDGSGFSIPTLSGVSYQVRTAGGNGQPFVVGLVERHSERSGGVGSLKVALSPPADQVTHQFDSRNKVALHTFAYERPADGLRGRIVIQFTTRESALAHAWRTAQAVIVDVSGRSDVLELTPPAASNR